MSPEFPPQSSPFFHARNHMTESHYNLVDMLWQTHIHIANEVLRKLGMPKSSIETFRLSDKNFL